MKFIGRAKELQILERALASGKAKVCAIVGRRRIGKSRLVEEFAKGKTFFALRDWRRPRE